MSKWFYKAQEEVKQRLQNLNEEYSCIEQVISNKDVFEKYLIRGDNMRVVLFQIKKAEYGKGYVIHEYITV